MKQYAVYDKDKPVHNSLKRSIIALMVLKCYPKSNVLKMLKSFACCKWTAKELLFWRDKLYKEYKESFPLKKGSGSLNFINSLKVDYSKDYVLTYRNK